MTNFKSDSGHFDFEQIIDRRQSDSIKWSKYAGRDIIPLWVADMDFAAPPAVLETLHRRIEHGVFGYAAPWPSLVASVLGHLEEQYDWHVDPDWIVWLPGVVTGLSLACRAIDGDVITATPVYPPFLSVPGSSGKNLAKVPLHFAENRWGWDFAAMEAALTPTTRLLLLCHPHNPVGRAWNSDELAALSEFCKRHDLIVCSDEIHCGLVLDTERQHIPLAMVDGEIAERSITLMAPSKTFNIPGLGCAFAVIQNPILRKRFSTAMRGIVPDINVLGLVAAEAAYRDCENWRKSLIGVLQKNRARIEEVISRLPALKMSRIEATYLAWIDARGLGVDDPARFFEEAGVGLSNGADFGLPGWVRLNFGCPTATLEAALARITAACTP